MRRAVIGMVVGATVGCLVTACSEDSEDATPGGGVCTAVACLGRAVEVSLIDGEGNFALARGEFRDTSIAYPPQPFDCSVHPDDSVVDLNCFGGTIHLDPFFVTADTEYEVRFQLDNGDYSEWQPLSLQITDRVIEDFNGPGCDCTVYDAFATPVEVPSEARLGTEPDGGTSNPGLSDSGLVDSAPIEASLRDSGD